MWCIGSAPTYYIVRIGECTPDQQVQINLLKGCVLLTELHGQKVDIETLLQAISSINDRCERRLFASNAS